jgi:hypothetical protein
MYDLFICHASEDKELVARPIAEALQDAASVWYDEFSLELGDSLRASIDKGLAESNFGLVILSPTFFTKNWPQAELNGLFAKEISGTKTILPIWHQMTKEQILQFSPILADRVAAKTENGLDSVVKQILDIIKPDELHFTRSLQTLSLIPTTLRLHTGAWEVKTLITITNLSKFPVYNIQIELALHPIGLEGKSVQVLKMPYNGPQLIGNAQGYSVDWNLVTLRTFNRQNQHFITLQILDLEAKGFRRFQVWGTEPRESRAYLSIRSFSDKPGEIFSKDGQTSIIFKMP